MDKIGILFAVYKNGTHLGNVREVSDERAISLYLFQSGHLKIELKNRGIIDKYKAIVAIEDIHYLSSLISD